MSNCYDPPNQAAHTWEEWKSRRGGSICVGWRSGQTMVEELKSLGHPQTMWFSRTLIAMIIWICWLLLLLGKQLMLHINQQKKQQTTILSWHGHQVKYQHIWPPELEAWCNKILDCIVVMRLLLHPVVAEFWWSAPWSIGKHHSQAAVPVEWHETWLEIPVALWCRQLSYCLYVSSLLVVNIQNLCVCP